MTPGNITDDDPMSNYQKIFQRTKTRSLLRKEYLRQTPMLYMLAIIIGLVVIIYSFSNGLKERNALVGKNKGERQGKSGSTQSPVDLANKRKKDLNEEDFNLLAKILSVGLVDADPNYLHHLKGYRDLRGAAT